ncbi:MAG: SAM-dependent methyltransferase, partial [Planctomycetota bacterium]|nr:SAM-dependent methyltransferase [Planctomycetota bacterium]
MAFDINRVRKHLKDFDFTNLFIEELGWDRHQGRLNVQIGDRVITLWAIAHKRGMVAYTCQLAGSRITVDDTIRKIETQVAKSVHEHLIIYTDANGTEQIWQWAKREPGKPIARRHHHYNVTQSGDSLIQKLQTIVFALEEEENLTIVDVSGRVRAAFDVERVTKRFYDRFKNEHQRFLDFINGIPDDYLQRWYASVMLNRLMFIYFIQKKRFLDDDENYLTNKLAQSKAEVKDSFYHNFLCPLFFEGFAKPPEQRDRKLAQLLGRIPYLNGGIFQKHQIEESHGKTISIPDKAFEKIFEFFEAYQWHLDERPLRNDNEINP